MRGLGNQVAVVTGGGGGIGQMICRRFAEEGARVAVLDIDAETARQTAESIGEPTRARAVAVDITDPQSVKRAISEVVEAFGGIDILVNNAGWDRGAPFLETGPELWAKIIAINYQGVLHMHREVLPLMVERKRGRVVNIASDAGRVGSSGEAVYAGCKAAVIAFGKSVAREMARSGITINAVCPGPTDTAFFRDFAGEGEYGEKLRAGLERAIPMRRLGQPDDIPGIVAFLASDDARFITGQVISVSGGLTMHG
ncbi:MAG: 2-hydroxycyclohexanecarboxyl-CoA dehydrogenase [Gemmatimonas sp. SG8_38_2]|nr:MAG: 2-hydroxycyclohexanecarboxyl-CoA dehydrogenase [Gemmatimonas sp. SG8_38_2]